MENQTHMLDYAIGFDLYKHQLNESYKQKVNVCNTMGGGERRDRDKTLRQIKRIIDNRAELEKVLEDYIKFKQCVMEKVIKRRQEYVPPNFLEAIDKIKAHNEKEAEKSRLRAKMTIKDIFAKPSEELSDQNNANIQKFTQDMVKTQENNKAKVKNLIKKFSNYTATLERDITFDGSEHMSSRTKNSKLSKRTGRTQKYL